jgi:hypothetical protein
VKAESAKRAIDLASAEQKGKELGSMLTLVKDEVTDRNNAL